MFIKLKLFTQAQVLWLFRYHWERKSQGDDGNMKCICISGEYRSADQGDSKWFSPPKKFPNTLEWSGPCIVMFILLIRLSSVYPQVSGQMRIHDLSLAGPGYREHHHTFTLRWVEGKTGKGRTTDELRGKEWTTKNFQILDWITELCSFFAAHDIFQFCLRIMISISRYSKNTTMFVCIYCNSC